MKSSNLVRKGISMLLAGSMAFTMAGCGNAGQDKNNGSGNEDQKQENVQSSVQPQTSVQEEDVTLRFMWWGSDARHEATLAVIDQYENLHPNVKIEAEYSGYDGYFEKLTTQVSGKTVADIVQFDASMTTDLLAMGDVFLDLSQYKGQLDTSDFDQNFLQSFSYYDNKLVGLPTGVNAGIWLTNTALLDEAGVKADQLNTWDDFIAAGEALQAADSNKYLFNIDITTLGKEVFYSMMAQITGKELIDPDSLKLNFTEQDLERVFTTFQDMYEKKVVEPAADSAPYDTQVSTNPKWISHELACTFTATSNITGAYYDFQDSAIAMNMPRYSDSKESGILFRPAQLIGVASNCKYPEAAAEFLDYFYNNEEAAAILKDCRSIPATSSGRRICEEQGFLDPVLVEAVEKAQETATANQNLSVPAEIVEILQDATEKIAYDQGTVKDIAKETMTLLTETMERLGK